MSLFQDAKSGEEFAAKILTTPSVIRQGGQGLNNVKVSSISAVVRFDPPQGHDKPWLDAIFLSNFFQQSTMLRHFLTPLLNSLGGDNTLLILQETHGGLRLSAVKLQDSWQGVDTLENFVEEGSVNPLGPRLCLERVDPLIKVSGAVRESDIEKNRSYKNTPEQRHASDGHRTCPVPK